MLELPGVTLACVDTANHALALRALVRSSERIRFGRVALLTDALPAGVDAPPGIDVVPIATLRSRDDYSRFVLKSLREHVRTPHVLLVQWDGYVVNADAWQPAFAQCDYLGAKWFWFDDAMRVGNGGFSLRSRRLLDALADTRIELVEAEDLTIGRTFRPLLESEYGIRFGTEALADRFAFEAAYPIGMPFGFHGLFNFCRVVPPAELATLARGFSDAIAGSKQIAQLLRNCIALAQWEPAAAIAERILAVRPDDGEARAALGQARASAAQGVGVGRNDPCPCGSGRKYKQCHGALGASPAGPASAPPTAAPVAPSADALVARAMDAHRRNDLDTAERDYRAALAIAPEHPHALHFLGVVDYQRGNAADALPRLVRAAELVPNEAEFHNNLGLALAALDRHDDAIDAYGRAIALRPSHAVALNNLGLAHVAARSLAKAIDAYRRALAIDASFVRARWNLALALLAHGDYAEGWAEYESRRRLPEFAPSNDPPGEPWDGHEPVAGTLLLVAEQGLGDAIQFVRFAARLAERGVRVEIRAPRALAPLLATAPGIAAVHPADGPMPAHDRWLPLLSLPHRLGIGAADLAVPSPYLAVDPARARTVAGELRCATGVRAGLAWSGSPRYADDRRRSAPLASLASLLALPDVAWYSLQKGDAESVLADVPGGERVVRHDARNDLTGTAALIEALDVVVTVDTSIGHLAGALGKDVFVMLPYSADWRWGVGRRDTPWYPTMRLFRQSAPGDWRGVAREVADALRARNAGIR